jgi:hypothetical protein
MLNILNMFLKLTVKLRMAKCRPKRVVLLNNIEFSCVQTVTKFCVIFLTAPLSVGHSRGF